MSETSNIVTANPCTPCASRAAWDFRSPTTTFGSSTSKPEQSICRWASRASSSVRGPTVMKEYWNNPEETAKTLRDGWLYTGDIAYLDTDGHVFIVDRKKDMILSSGFNVYPREIDELMYTHPKVLQACSFGIPRPPSVARASNWLWYSSPARR